MKDLDHHLGVDHTDHDLCYVRIIMNQLTINRCINQSINDSINQRTAHATRTDLAGSDVTLSKQGFVERHEAELTSRRARAVVVPPPRSFGHP